MPCQDADPQARQTHPLRNDADNVGIAVPTFLKSHQPLVPRVPCAPTGSIQCETSASCGPVATPSGSLIRPLAEAKNRTTRVLPNPDNSCAYDNGPLWKWQPSRLHDMLLHKRVGLTSGRPFP